MGIWEERGRSSSGRCRHAPLRARVSHPPPDWPQRVRRTLPFPPGGYGQRFEVYMDASDDGWRRFEINLSTLEVFERVDAGWRAPGWTQLPPRVKARIWTLSESR